MARVRLISKQKTSRINRAAQLAATVDHSVYCRDLDRWPRSWMGVEKDVPPGEELVACFRPFIEHLAISSLSPKTIRRHIDNLWLLGGEIIRDLNYDPALRKIPADRLVAKVIHEDGGPLLYNGSEEEQRSFDATCRKLHRFRSQSQA
jgi:hypothetical protein